MQTMTSTDTLPVYCELVCDACAAHGPGQWEGRPAVPRSDLRALARQAGWKITDANRVYCSRSCEVLDKKELELREQARLRRLESENNG